MLLVMLMLSIHNITHDVNVINIITIIKFIIHCIRNNITHSHSIYNNINVCNCTTNSIITGDNKTSNNNMNKYNKNTMCNLTYMFKGTQ